MRLRHIQLSLIPLNLRQKEKRLTSPNSEALGRRANKAATLSVCIPAYRAERYIPLCLESIRRQGFQDYEVVIVDDGSPIPLRKDMLSSDRYFMKKVRLIRTQNSGPYSARQTAVANARGEWIYFMDADDVLADDEALGHMVAKLVETQCDILFVNAYLADKNGRMTDYSRLQDLSTITASDVMREMVSKPFWNNLYTIVFRRRLLKPAPEQRRLLMAEDRLQKAELVTQAKSFAVLDEIVYLYIENMVSITQSDYKAEYWEQQRYVEDRVVEMCEPLGIGVEKWGPRLLRISLGALRMLALSKAVSEQEYPAICKVTTTWPLYRRALRTSASELSPRNRLEAQILEKGYFRAIARIYKLCAMVGHAG